MPKRTDEELKIIYEDFRRLDEYQHPNQKIKRPSYKLFDGKTFKQERNEFIDKIRNVYRAFNVEIGAKTCELEGGLNYQIEGLTEFMGRKFYADHLLLRYSKDSPIEWLDDLSWNQFMKLLKSQVEGKNSQSATVKLENILDSLEEKSYCNTNRAYNENLIDQAKDLAFNPEEVTISQYENSRSINHGSKYRG